MKEVQLKDEKIYIDFSLINKSKQSQLFNITLSDDEKSIFSNLDHFEKLDGYYTIDSNDSNLYYGNCYLNGLAVLIDARDISKKIEYSFNNEVDYQIVLNDENESDILPDENGKYDIRTAFLALIYDAIPPFITNSELKSGEDNVNYFTEEEFKNKQ